MSVYELILYTCLLLSFFKKTRNNKILILLTLCWMLCVAAFRSLDVGTDTWGYYDSFLSLNNMHSLTEKNLDEIVYSFITYVLHRFFNYDWYMLFWYSCIIFSVGYVINKASVNKFLSLFLFISCCFYTNSLNVMRQFVAAFIMFLAIYEYSKEEFSKCKIILICLFCFFIHNASIIVWPLFFLKNVQLNKRWQFIVVIGSFVLGFFLVRYLQPVFVVLSSYVGRFENYLLREGDGDGARNFISNFGVNVMFITSLFLASTKTLNSIFFKSYFVSMILFNLVGSMYYLTRITEFYAIAQIISIPIVVQETKNKIYKNGYIILLLMYCFSRFYMKGLYSFLPYAIRDNINLI